MAHAIVFFARKFSYLFFYHYLCTDLASPVGLDWVKTSMDYAPKGMKGRFQNVIFNKIKLRKLDQPEDIATKRPRWVYYIRMSSTLWLVHIFYNTQWRGLAKLLISVEGQCEGLILWDRQRKFLPRLFCSKPYYIIIADAGRSGKH